tara:strand:+ start:1910 stop:2035 length:126 start_codon:yes stop_codon:yes gene_type:complete
MKGVLRYVEGGKHVRTEYAEDVHVDIVLSTLEMDLCESITG